MGKPSLCWSSSSRIWSAYRNILFSSMHTNLKRLQLLSMSTLARNQAQGSYIYIYMHAKHHGYDFHIQTSRVHVTRFLTSSTCFCSPWRYSHFSYGGQTHGMVEHRNVRKYKVQGLLCSLRLQTVYPMTAPKYIIESIWVKIDGVLFWCVFCLLLHYPKHHEMLNCILRLQILAPGDHGGWGSLEPVLVLAVLASHADWTTWRNGFVRVSSCLLK